MMKKYALTYLAIAISAFASVGQTAYLQCDFAQGIPADFTLVDGDGRQPAAEMAALGFEIGIPWIAVPVGKDLDMAACSTSWYKNAGKADDWMITPGIDITSTDAIISWRAMASDKELRDGYAVYISTTGCQRSDFDGLTPVLKVNKEENQWTNHELSLAEYAGKTIAIAFVNNSNDKTMLYVDDLFVGVPAKFSFETNLGRIYNGSGEMHIVCTVKADKGMALDGFRAGYTIGEYTNEFVSDKRIEAGDSYTFEFEPLAQIDKFATVDYRLWVESMGDHVEQSGDISAYAQTVVAEEITGTWCGYCVRGIAAMEKMRELAPDNFIGIAIHADVNHDNWPDAMGAGVEEYYNEISSKYGMSGFPNCILNRNMMYKGDPGNIPTWYETVSASDRDVTGVMLTCEYDAVSRQINACTYIGIAADMQNVAYKLAYVLIENDVHRTYAESEGQMPNGYEQNNYYAGGRMGECGGFEELPATLIADKMWYQDVARGIYPDIEGVTTDAKGDVNDGDMYSHSYTITMPENVLRVENVWLAVLLIDREGIVRNADKVRVAANVEGISDIMTDIESGDEFWYDIIGRKVKNPTKGLYIHKGKKVIIK